MPPPELAMQKNQMATYRGCKRRMSGGCGSGTPLPWIEIRTRGDEDGMETPLEKEHAGHDSGA
jgi:radical SAM superfamily enzyme with C-terminal helix-hairpin-helix motif